MYLLYNFSISNKMNLSRGCRRFCRTTLNIVSRCLASIEQLSVHHRSAHGEPESPTIGIRAYGLKGCLILIKNESCQNCVLTIPLCRGGRDEATGENGVEIVLTHRHVPARMLDTRTDARHAPHASSPPE
jgi:hypothetical protein